MSKRLPVAIVLDSSSSMRTNQLAVIQGFEQFVGQLSKEPLPVRLSLFSFADEVRDIYLARPLGAADPLTTETYSPEGNTALYDAMMRAIDRLEVQVESGKVIVAVLTDGEENCSDTEESVLKARVAAKTAQGWEFLILGAAEGYTRKLVARLGLPPSSAQSFKADPAGTVAGFLDMAKTVKGLLCGAKG